MKTFYLFKFSKRAGALIALCYLVFNTITLDAQTYVTIGHNVWQSGDEDYQFVPTSFSSAKQQFLILNEDMVGVHAGVEIIGVEWNVTTDNTPGTTTFDIYLNDDYTNALMPSNASFVTNPMTQVGNGITDSGSFTGWHTANFTTPYIWDGSDNLILQTCRTGGGVSISDVIQNSYTTLPSDNNNAYTISGYNHTCTASSGYYSRNNRPYMRLIVNCTPTSSTINPILCGTPYTSPSGKTFNAPGIYMDTIPNSTFCDSVITINLTSCFTATVSNTTNVSCNKGSDGSIEVTITEGTAPYSDGTNSYNSNPFVITGLSAGPYSYTITDNNGSTASISGTIAEPTPVSVTVDNTMDISCFGSNDGMIEVSASGGNGTGGGSTGLYISEANPNSPDFIEITTIGSVDVTGYQVVISNSYSNISDSNPITWQLSGILSGNTVLYREDNYGSNYWGNNIFWSSGNPSWAIIIDPQGNIVDALFWGWSAANIANFSINVGGITVANNGDWVGDGIDPYCSASFSRTGSNDSNSATDWTCAASTKGINNMNISPSYTYNWSSGQSGSTISGLSQGSYTVTATDALGCTATTTATISEPTAITSSAVATACSNGADGEITVTTSGGTGTLEYSSDNGGTFQSSNILTGLATGSYDVVVKDANGCMTAAETVNVTACAFVQVGNITNVNCPGGNDGAVELISNSGVAPFTVNGNTYNSSPFTITGLTAGVHTFTVTDNAGNSETVTVTISTGNCVPAFTIDDVTKAEGNWWGITIFKFTVTRSGGTGAATVDFATQDGTAISTGFNNDYTTLYGTVTFTNGGTNTKFINVAVKKDNNAEPDENFFVNLSNPSGSSIITDAQAVGTILNDDGAPVTVDPNEGNQSIQSQHFVEADLELNVYPNPVREVLNIELSAHPISNSPANSQLKMVDLNGRTIWTHRVQNQENFIQVPTGDWSSGAYILYWINDQNVKTQKVIIE